MLTSKNSSLAAKAIRPDSSRDISTFIVIFGYAWTCLAKSGAAIGKDDGIYHIFFQADYRAPLDPPVPANYFGNCLGFLFVKSRPSLLIGNDGFLVAEKLIGEAIYKRFFSNKEEVLKSAEDWGDQFEAMDWSQMFAAAGSPRVDIYDADFGWGRPKKFEAISIDAGQLLSICKLRDSEKKSGARLVIA